MQYHKAIAILCTILFLPVSGVAKIKPIPIAELIAESDLVLIVGIQQTVDRSEDIGRGVWEAHGQVQEILKGEYPGETIIIEFYVSNIKPTPKRLAKGIQYILLLVKDENQYRMTNQFLGSYSMLHETHHYYEDGDTYSDRKLKSVPTGKFIEMIKRITKQPNKAL